MRESQKDLPIVIDQPSALLQTSRRMRESQKYLPIVIPPVITFRDLIEWRSSNLDKHTSELKKLIPVTEQEKYLEYIDNISNSISRQIGKFIDRTIFEIVFWSYAYKIATLYKNDPVFMFSNGEIKVNQNVTKSVTAFFLANACSLPMSNKELRSFLRNPDLQYIMRKGVCDQKFKENYDKLNKSQSSCKYNECCKSAWATIFGESTVCKNLKKQSLPVVEPQTSFAVTGTGQRRLFEAVGVHQPQLHPTYEPQYPIYAMGGQKSKKEKSKKRKRTTLKKTI
jgi:hypothetical protein